MSKTEARPERAELAQSTPGRFSGKDHRDLDLQSHFAEFFARVTGEAMTETEHAFLREVLGELGAEEQVA